MCRNFGLRPSRILRLSDEAVALDFDMAATVAVERHTQEIDNNRAQLLMSGGAMSAFSGGPDNGIFEPRAGVTYNENTLAV